MTATQSYQADAITTASPAQLVLMMYDGALASIDRAIAAGDPGAEPSTFEMELLRVARILAELRGVLDFERGGEIAQNLDALYTFCIDLLADATEDGSADPLSPVSEIIRTLRDSWADAVAS